MTENKFWLVLNQAREVSKNKHTTKSDAVVEAKQLSYESPQNTYFVVEAVCEFKANIDVIETDLTVSEVETPTSEITIIKEK